MRRAYFPALFFLAIIPLVYAQCSLPADQEPCDNIITIGELTGYIDTWYSCSACAPNLLETINAYYSSGCIPDCAGRQCGDDGCGGDCGPCGGGQYCDGGTCVVTTGNTIFVDRLLASDCLDNYSAAYRDCSGSDGDAYNTIAEGVNAAYPGDTVFMMGSTDPNSPDAVYNVTTNGITTRRSGLPGQRITMRSYPGHTVIIQGDGGDAGIYLDFASYHTFKGLAFRNFNKATESWARINGTIIDGCEFSQTFETGLRLRNVDDFLMKDSYVHDCYEAGISVMGDDATFINVESSHNWDNRGEDSDADGFASSYGINNLTFINCTARDNQEDGFDLTGDATLINAIAAGNWYCNIKFWRRVGDDYAPHTSYVINSLMYGAGEAGIKVSAGAEMHVYNSVVYGNGEEGIAFRGFNLTQGPRSISSTIVNTIISVNGLEGIGVDNYIGGTYVNSTNNVSSQRCIFYGNGARNNGMHSDIGNITADPMFFGPGVNDFHLKGGSPAIDSGIPLPGTVDRDFEGKSRPIDGDNDAVPAWDIGAFESSAVAGNTGPSFTYSGPTSFTVMENNELVVDLPASDPDGDGLRYLISSGDILPEMSIDNSGRFRFAPNYDRSNSSQENAYDVVIGVTDEHYYYPPDEMGISITVQDVNRPPVYSGLDYYTLIEGRDMRIKFPISDPDGKVAISSTLSGLPASASYDEGSFILDWSGSAQDIGPHSARLTISDGVDSKEFGITFNVLPAKPYQEVTDEANVFYVDGTAGNDTWNGQTPSTAWRMIQRAKNMLAAGQMVLIRGGIYHEYGSIARSGTPDNPIIFKAYPGELVIMNGSGFSSPEAFNFGGGASNIVIDGIHFMGYGETIYFRGSNSNISLLNLDIRDADQGVYGAANNIRIENVTVSGIGDRGIYAGNNAHLYNVSVSDYADRGIVVYTADNANILRSRVYDSGPMGTAGILAGGGNIFIADTLLMNNSGSGAAIYNAYAYIRNLVSYGTRLRSGSAQNLYITGQFELYNSVLHNSSRYGLQVTGTGPSMIRNCIIWGNQTQVITAYPLNEDYNIFGAGFAIRGSHSSITDPMFVGGGDFHLRDGSPAIDNGTYVGIPYSGSAPDIGAYERG